MVGVKGFAVGVIIFLGCITTLKAANNEAGLVNEQCLRCLCEASTECNEEAGCTSESPSQYLCGPYAISYHYWKDGGSPGADPSDPLDFERCLTHKPCAEAAVKGYVNRWARDCDGDGRIDCFDWALLHKAGPEACAGAWARTTDFFAQFKACYAPFAKQIDSVES